jgi:hypothetical protein
MTEAARLIVMARWLARKAIKDRLQARGIRPMMFETAEITKAADALLEVRKGELIAEAKLWLSH